MKIKKLIIEGYRGYSDRTEVLLDNLNVIVGVNDIGKSTILDALDNFFNEADANVKLSSEDFNKKKAKEVKIGVVFSDFQDEIIIDSTYPTSLKDEYLLNADGLLEIYKVFGKTTSKVILECLHPINKDIKGLINLDINALKEKAEKLGVPEAKYNASIKASIRKAIREHIGANTECSMQNIEIYNKKGDNNKSDAKEIWDKLQNYLPIYALFQADRKNQENDNEVQKPMKAAIKSILANPELQIKLETIKKEVQEATEAIAKLTLEKLSEINDQLAKELTPKFENPKWDSAFKFNLFSDDDISLDKRGSGVRRLFLISFFMAEAEKRKKEKHAPNVIYAIEEPETSQHPKHQHKLIESLINLSHTENTQIILTTHSPSLASMLPTESITVIYREENGNKKIERGNDDILRRVTDELGVYANFTFNKDITKVKLAICVEGHTDIEFLLHINKNIPELKSIIDIESDEIILLPMGGSTLQFWVNNDYLYNLKLRQFHIYDSDIGSSKPNKYKDQIEKINTKGASFFAIETNYNAMENYISPSLLNERYSTTHFSFTAGWNKLNLPVEVAKFNPEKSESPTEWNLLTLDDIKEKVGPIKKAFCTKLAPKISAETLKEINAYEEIKSWHEKMAQMIAPA